MKRIAYILLLFCTSLPLAGQNKEKRWRIDITLDQNFLLKPMIDDAKANRFMEGGTTDISFRYYYRIGGNWSVLAEAMLPPCFSFNNKHTPMTDSYINYFGEIDNNLNGYYVKDIRKQKPIILTTKVFAGAACHHYMKNWEIRPVVGAGLKYMESASISYTLKKIDSNEAYDVKYSWMRDDGRNKIIGFLSGEINAAYYPKKRKSGILLGVSFRQYLSGVEFRKEMRDFYTKEAIDSRSICGRKNNMLGIKLGVTF